MKTTFAKKSDLQRKWYIIDAKDKVLGRLSTEIANILRGKNKPIFSPHVDCGDHIIVINAAEVKLTGSKESQKNYYSHSGFPSGLKTVPVTKLRREKPAEILRKAVLGMLPKNRLRKPIIQKLHIFAGPEHEHAAQKPEPLEIN